MAIIFPASPTLNDIFIAGDRQWKWNGTSWQSIVAGESDPTMGGDLSGTASTAQIIADAVGSTEIATDAVTTGKINLNVVTDREISAGAIGATEIASTFDISSKTVTLPAASVTAHVTAYNDTNLRNDIATLALQSAIISNQAAYNLANAFIDQFEDDTGIDVETTCDRAPTEFMASIYEVTAPADVGGTLTGVGDSNTYYSGGGTNDTYGDGNDPGSGSYNYSWWSAPNGPGDARLLTGLCMWEIHGGNTTQATNTDSGSANKWDWGMTSQAGQTADHQSGANAQANTNLNDSSASLHSAGAPMIFASSGGTGQSISLASAMNNTTRTIIATLTDATIDWSSGKSARFVRKDSTLYFQVDGVTYHTFDSSDFNYSGDLNGTLGMGISSGNFVDVNYRSNMTAAKGLITSAINATGNFTSTTQTALSTVSNMGIIVLYKENAGTTTLNTDLVAKISADGGTNYETVTLSPAGTFSTGIKTAVANSVNMPNTGTAPKYKIEFANQLAGTQHTITAAGNGTISTFKKVFGTGSYYGDGTGDYLSIPESTDWDFDAGDFTMECWVNFNTVDPMGHGFSTFMWLGNYMFDYKVATTELRIILQGMPAPYNLSATWVPTIGTWYHIAAVRNGADLKLFVDGTQIGSTLDVSTNATPAGGSGASFIGCRRPNLDRFFNGHMDEVRVSDTARYTANFTPTTSAFTPDTNTKLLVHFEDPTLNVWPATPHQSTNFLDDDFACETQVHGVALLY